MQISHRMQFDTLRTKDQMLQIKMRSKRETVKNMDYCFKHLPFEQSTKVLMTINLNLQLQVQRQTQSF